ncbi:chromosome segregation ATPase [Paenibacillus luteus]|uniref:chromosome segregation ATPase n=1 Tax=Paenibacillus luteus TaxID=2545753 RepID=UPI0011428F12|nr:chromosome segregation ATPase [Paenibacillus luteus]
MPAISKIRFTHILYEGGNKRYNDETFLFDGHNAAIVLENGGGKTVFIQTALQAMLPHTDLAGRKLKDTLLLENGPAHIAIEWILNDKPRRRYAVTCVSIFLNGNNIDSYRYAYEYGEHDSHSLDHIPFVKEYMGKTRPSDKGEIQEYYASMTHRFPLTARTFATIKEYKAHLEEAFHIIAAEWESIVKINDTEGGIEAFFDECKATSQLFNRLLIPTVERAMGGYEQDTFVKMFESHREGFKRYKELKEQISENQLILQELNQYVLLYEKLNKSEEQYNAARGEAKAYRILTRLQHAEQKAEQSSLGERYRQWESQQELLQRQLKSLELAEVEQERTAIVVILQQLQEEADSVNGRLRQAQRSYYSMQYAELRVKHEGALARLTHLEKQMARLEQSEDEKQLQERWEQNGGELRSVFAQREQEYTTELQEYTAELNHLKRELAKTEKMIESLQGDYRIWELKQQVNQTMLKEKNQQRDNLARNILANPTLEKIEEQIPIWSTRQQQLEEERIDHLRHIKQLNDERGVVMDGQKALEGEILDADRMKTKLEQQQEQLQAEHIAVIRELAILRPNWERLTLIYDKEASIIDQLKEGIVKRQEQKELYLQKERLAYRYVDDYNGQDIFFADPMVERMLKSWGRQFTLLQTGIEYLTGLGIDLGESEWKDDRFWAVTLVTTDSEKPALKQKLITVEDEFAYPIRVLSVSEASVLVRGLQEEDQEQWIVPTHWKANRETETFQRWKEDLLQHAELIREEREKKEEELQLWQRTELQVRKFLEKYPLSQYQAIEIQVTEKREQLFGLMKEQNQRGHLVKQLEESMEKYRIELTEKQDLIHQLSIWLKDGQLYLTLGTEMKKIERELAPIQEQMTSLNSQLRMSKHTIEGTKVEHEAVIVSYNDTNTKLQILRNDDMYRAAQSFVYVKSSRSLVDLKEVHKVLERERDGMIKERKELELERNHEQEKEGEAKSGMQQLLREHPELDIRANLPIDLETHKQEEWSRIEQYNEQVQFVAERLNRKRDKLKKIEVKTEFLMQQFNESFSGEQPTPFETALLDVKSGLEQTVEKLKLEKKELQQRNDYVEGQLRELDSVMQLWEKYMLLHRLDDDRLQPIQMEENKMIDFLYKRMSISERSIKMLQSNYEAVEKESSRVRKGMYHFKDYCISHVRDIKLRQMAIQGVEVKETYSEVTEFHRTMETRIRKAIQFMMETIQTHDRDLQEFIQRIHMHLKQIVQELRELPKKTRIRTADGWREIYSFTIPEWDDREGKDRVREHIEWILNQLERGQFFDEQGKELQNDVRKSLEKWLDSKQLLQVVLNSETMKVMCRKVTNDHQVTKAAYSWEQSNRWSGGEKWSKNMTLFLGLLNYVAERKQYIKASMKLHRTVILDNPFGKASSDHVLSPVFFIAEQLGFQIIALTAHAEGKFLQDYFPIVYSCRLRIASDASKQIVESSKRVQHAYLRDNSPDTLERIDARMGQITLF